MTDLIPWQALTAAGGGWFLLGIAVWMVFTGRLVTSREHEAVVRRAEKAEENVDKLTELGSELIETARASRAMYEALQKAAKS